MWVLENRPSLGRTHDRHRGVINGAKGVFPMEPTISAKDESDESPPYSEDKFLNDELSNNGLPLRHRRDGPQLVALVEKRFQRARELARGKKQSGVPVIDSVRELSILKRVAALSSRSPCRANIFARFRQVLQESRAVQLRTAEPEDRPKKRQPERRLS